MVDSPYCIPAHSIIIAIVVTLCIVGLIYFVVEQQFKKADKWEDGQ